MAIMISKISLYVKKVELDYMQHKKMLYKDTVKFGLIVTSKLCFHLQLTFSLQ